MRDAVSDMPPSVTIIVPVLHSVPELLECLKSIDKLDYPHERFRTVVVDCGVVDGVEALSRTIFPTLNTTVSLIPMPADSIPNSPSWLRDAPMNAARNTAMAAFPADIFVFTEDDCTFAPQWLVRIASEISGSVGGVGGPEILPDDMSWFPQSMDFVLNSRVGSGAMRRGKKDSGHNYYPRKQNMAYSGRVIAEVGPFPLNLPVSGELYMATAARGAGYDLLYLENNPVWHRRVNTLGGFLRLTAYTAAQNVVLLKRRRQMWRSAYSVVLALVACGLFLFIMSAIRSDVARLLAILSGVYIAIVVLFALTCAVKAASAKVLVGTTVLTVAHHLGVVSGSIRGMLTRVS